MLDGLSFGRSETELMEAGGFKGKKNKGLKRRDEEVNKQRLRVGRLKTGDNVRRS